MQPNTSQAIEIATHELQNSVADSTTCTSSSITNDEQKEVDSYEANIVDMDDDAVKNDLSSAQQTVIENVASTNSESNMSIQSTAAPDENSFTCTNSNQTLQCDAQQKLNDTDGKTMDGSHEAEPYDNGCLPTATSSCISITENDNAIPKLNDTTQELNVEAFNSDLDEMDRLEFASSDSPASSDSGNITANTSCAITNQSADTCQTTNSLTDKQLLGDNSISELSITSTALETDAVITDPKDGQNMTTENEPNQDYPEPSSTSHESFAQISEIVDTNCTLESNSLSEVSMADSTMFKTQTDISNASSEQAQENIVSTSNDGLVAEPSNDYVESAQSIHSMATCSTPARAIGKFNTCHSLDRSMQKNVTQEPSVQCVGTQLNMIAAALSISSKCESQSTEIKPLEAENEVEISTPKHSIHTPVQNNENEMTAQTVEKDTVLATPENDITIELTHRNRTIRAATDSFTPKRLDISFTKHTSPTLATTDPSELLNIEPTQSDDDITVQQQSDEIVSAADESQGEFLNSNFSTILYG